MTTEAKLVSQELPQLLTGLLPRPAAPRFDPSFAFPVPTPLCRVLQNTGSELSTVAVRREVEGKLPRVTMVPKSLWGTWKKCD